MVVVAVGKRASRQRGSSAVGAEVKEARMGRKEGEKKEGGVG